MRRKKLNTSIPQSNIQNAAPPPIGSSQNVYDRLIQQLPPWFGTDHPVKDIDLQAYVSTGVFNYDQFQYDLQQMRLQTATGDNLDLFSEDYFGNLLPRNAGENDDSYRNRISANLLQEKATRPGMYNALLKLTGFPPVIFEPFNSTDCGGYNAITPYVSLAYGTPSIPGSGTGKYGSSSYAYQAFVDVYVSGFNQMGNYSGYNDFYFGYNYAGAPAIGWYGNDSLDTIGITDQNIYQTINLTKCEGTIVWVAIHRIT